MVTMIITHHISHLVNLKILSYDLGSPDSRVSSTHTWLLFFSIKKKLIVGSSPCIVTVITLAT